MEYRITERQKQLIFLLSREQVVTGELLAKQLSITSRTVRSEVTAVNTIFNCALIRATPKGYSIDPQYFHLTQNADVYSDKNTLKAQLTWELFSGRCSNNAAELAEKYFITPAVINQQLKAISKDLAPYQLKLVKCGAFYQVEGSEFARRVFLNTIVLAETHNGMFESQAFDSLFEGQDITQLRSRLLEILFENDLQLDQVNLDSLVLNIAIAFDRLLKGMVINYVLLQLPFLPQSAEYRSACAIAQRFTERYGISVSDNDVRYLYLLVFGQTRHRYEGLLEPEFIKTIDDILKQTFSHFNLFCPYESVLENLAYHIYFLIIRCHVGNATYNALVDNLKTQTPFLYDVAVGMAKLIQDTFSVVISDQEIGYLALVLGGMLEQDSFPREKLNVVIVCGAYQIIGQRIQKKLEERFAASLNFLGTIPRLPHNVMGPHRNVLFLSCLPEPVPYENVLTIGAVPSDADFCRIENYISRLHQKQAYMRFLNLTRDFFSEKLFFHNLQFESKYDAISFLAGKAVEYGYANAGFAEEVLQRERTSSTCFLDAFALPHPLTFSANRSALCVLSSDTPFMWDEHQIKFVCLLVLSESDRERFHSFYPHLVKLLCDMQSLAALSEAADFSSFVEQLNRLV